MYRTILTTLALDLVLIGLTAWPASTEGPWESELGLLHVRGERHRGSE